MVCEIVIADAALVVADPGSHGTRKIYNRKLGKQELLEFMVAGNLDFVAVTVHLIKWYLFKMDIIGVVSRKGNLCTLMMRIKFVFRYL